MVIFLVIFLVIFYGRNYYYYDRIKFLDHNRKKKQNL